MHLAPHAKTLHGGPGGLQRSRERGPGVTRRCRAQVVGQSVEKASGRAQGREPRLIDACPREVDESASVLL